MKESKMSGDRIAVYVPEHPKANNRDYILRARFVVEQKLGRYLLKDEQVHHINENKLDDRIENLEVVSISEHAKIHHPRKLNYDLILDLRNQGYGYKRISVLTNYPRSSVRSALKIMGV